MGIEITRLIYVVNEDSQLGRLLRSDRRVSALEIKAFRTCKPEVELDGKRYRILRDRVYNDGDDLVADVRYERIN